MKSIRFSNHARRRMAGHGATEAEAIETIQSGKWQSALQNKMQTRKTFVYDKPSPVNQKVYAFKTVHVVFVEEESTMMEIKESFP